MKKLLLLLSNAFIVSIALAQSVPLPPTNLTVSNVSDSSFIAKWSPSAGAFGYRMDLSTSANFSTGNVFIGQGTPFTSDTTFNLQAGTTYYFRVRAVNASGISANSVIKSLVTVPAAPILHGVVTAGETSLLLAWDAAKGATGYRVDVTRSNFDSLIYSNLDARNNTSLQINNLKRGRFYSFRVRAVNSYGTSDNSNVATFQLQVPTPVTLPATNINTTGFTANWSFALHGPTVHYSLWVMKDSVVTFTTQVVGVTSANISGLSGGVYTYQLLAYIVGDWGQTNASNPTQVRVPFPTPVSNGGAIYPNPVKSSEYLNLNIKNLAPRESVKVQVTSFSSDQSFQYNFETNDDGVLNSRIPVTMLKPGIYLLKVDNLSYRFVVE